MQILHEVQAEHEKSLHPENQTEGEAKIEEASAEIKPQSLFGDGEMSSAEEAEKEPEKTRKPSFEELRAKYTNYTEENTGKPEENKSES